MKAMRSSTQTMETEFITLHQAEEKMAWSLWDGPASLFEPTLSKEHFVSPPCSQRSINSSQDSIGCGSIPDLVDIDDLLSFNLEDSEQFVSQDAYNVYHLEGGDQEVAETLNDFLNDPTIGQELSSIFGHGLELAQTIENSATVIENTQTSQETWQYETPSPHGYASNAVEINETDLLDEEDTEAMAIFEDALIKALSIQSSTPEKLNKADEVLALAMDSGFSGRPPMPFEILESSQVSPPESPIVIYQDQSSPSTMSSFPEDSNSSLDFSCVNNSRKRKCQDSDVDYAPKKSAKTKASPSSKVKTIGKRRRSSDEKQRSQNKDAALRYRQRRKEQLIELEKEEEIVLNQTRQLEGQMKELSKELNTIESLFLAAGSIDPNWRASVAFQKYCLSH